MFNEGLFHGQISESKGKAKTSCAMVLAQNLVELGWTDFDKRIVKRQKVVKSKPVKKRKKEASEVIIACIFYIGVL